MPSMSKYALRFQNRVIAFEEDVELVDIICTARKKNVFLQPEEKREKLFRYLDPTKHVHLRARKVRAQSKRIVVNHLRKTVYVAYIKDIFEELMGYLKSLLYEAALLSRESSKAKRLLGEHKVDFSATDLLQYQSLNDLVMKIAGDIIQALENERSTKSLIIKVCKKIDLGVDKSTITDALPYLELRHKLVHTDGRVDNSFKIDYPMFRYDKENRIILNYDVISEAKEKITKLVLEIDNAAIDKKILTENTPNND